MTESARTGHLTTEWSTDDPAIARTLQLISGETDPVAKLELEATLHQWQANDCLRQAERYRQYRARRLAARPARA